MNQHQGLELGLGLAQVKLRLKHLSFQELLFIPDFTMIVMQSYLLCKPDKWDIDIS